MARLPLLAFLLSSLGLFGQAGQLDLSFGVNGIASVDVDTAYYSLRDMAVQSDGKIVLTGRLQADQGWDVYVIRCLPGGAPDTAFGDMGLVRTDLGTFWDEGRAVTVQPDGKIVVAAQSSFSGFQSKLVLLRYEPDGTPDNSFGIEGVAIARPPLFGFANDIALKDAGEIVVAGTSVYNDEYTVYQFTSAGVRDSTFHVDGTLSASLAFGFNVAQRVVVQEDGSIVLAVMFGYGGSYDVGLVRLQSNGSYDSNFGNGGAVTISVSPGDELIGGLGMQGDGGYILAGRSDQSPTDDMFAARFTSSGPVDTGFGVNGIALVSSSAYPDRANDLLIQSDDAILLCGTSALSTVGNSRVVLARLASNGVLDEEFGNGGIITTQIPGNPAAVGYRIGMQPDGRVIVAVYGGIHPMLLRYLIGDPIGVQENLGTDDLVMLFPNPASDKVTVQVVLDSPSTINLDVMDAAGRIMVSSGSHRRISAGSHRIQLPIGQLAPGVYTVLFSAKGQRQAMKLVKE